MIELVDVSFSYPARAPVLNRISTHFEAGKFYGIFGPNGCGKSTMLKLITGELKPASGKVTPEWTEPLERARNLAVVEQEVPSRIPLTIREIVTLGRYPWERLELNLELIGHALKMLHLSDLAGVPYSKLSGGERQRVMLARAVAQETPILLLDEPASSLDIGFQHNFYRILRDLAKKGKCVIMVSHDLFIAPEYLDEILMLKNGRIVQHGTPQKMTETETLRMVFGIP